MNHPKIDFSNIQGEKTVGVANLNQEGKSLFKNIKHMNLYKPSLLIIFILWGAVAFAQPGQSVVIIQGTFTPSVDDAQKVTSSPSLKDTLYKVPEFNYDIEEKKLETPFKVSPIKPARLIGEPLSKLYSNYAALGMGNYLTPYFEFYHSKLRSRDTKYGVHLKHLSSAGEIDNYAFPAWSSNLAEVYASKFWKKSVFDVSVAYEREVNHFYGFEPALYPDSVLPKDVDIAQRYNLVNADLRWYRYRLRKKEMNYDIRGNYYFLNDYYRNAEHHGGFSSQLDWNTDFVKSFKTERLGFELVDDFYHNIWDTMPENTTNLLSVVPFYKFEYGPLSVKFGINLQVKTDTTSSMFFYPQLSLNLAAIPDVLYFNLNLAGGHYRNSLKTLSDENPFIISQIPLDFTNRKYMINFGLGSSISKSVNFDIQLYYDRLENSPLFVTDTNELYDNKFTVIYDNYDRVKLQMDITYQKHERLRFLLRGNYYVYNMTTELFPWHKPNYDVSLTANYNIQDKILFKAAIISYGSSKVPDWEEGVLVPQTLKAWVDLNFGVEYRYRKKLGIFLNVNNVTAARYYRWHNYPSYKFNFMAGFSYIF